MKDLGSVWLLLLVLCSFRPMGCTRVYNIQWNASNPIFRIDRTDNVIDVNAGNHPWEYDQVNIVCPNYRSNVDEAYLEKYIIYSVSKEEYESCRITQPQPKVIAVCNRPYDFMYFTITFRSFTPTPGGLEFHPGRDYYFISTSSVGDLHRRAGGGCAVHNMRLMFKVATEAADKSTEVDNELPNTIENHLTPPERYHPWHLTNTQLESSSHSLRLLGRRRHFQPAPSQEFAFYYPLRKSGSKQVSLLDLSIHRGGRRASLNPEAVEDIEVEITSGSVSRFLSLPLWTFAILVAAARLSTF